MDYFVSISNTPYHHWQIELLIESFKMHGLQDSLLVVLYGEDENKFPPNLFHHKRKLLPGDNKKLPIPAAKIFSVLSALKHSHLSQPFTFLHPDMVLVQPITDDWDEGVVFHPHRREEDMVAGDVGYPGGIMRFKWMPYRFFHKVMGYAMNLVKENEKYAGPLAWEKGINEYIAPAGVRALATEMSLLHIGNAPFIHYKYGMPPSWTKHAYKPFMSFMDDPYNVLLAHNPTSSSNYLHKIILSYMERRTKRKW